MSTFFIRRDRGDRPSPAGRKWSMAVSIPAVFKDSFCFFLVPGLPGGGSGLSFSLADRGFGAGAGPDPGPNVFLILILALSAAGTCLTFA